MLWGKLGVSNFGKLLKFDCILFVMASLTNTIQQQSHFIQEIQNRTKDKKTNKNISTQFMEDVQFIECCYFIKYLI